ncbi:MAG: HNH endonuclease, partial [Holophagales bacterium]|nr:HNH endonuclease [Holophagales bacterium]
LLAVDVRPVLRGPSPRPDDFDDFRDAFPELIARLGRYCSYCERPILTNLAVEHVQPKKGPFGRPELEGRWENFLLGCVNCNSTKKDKEVVFTDLLFPDRDNTFRAFLYTADGEISPDPQLDPGLTETAEATLKLTGLDKPIDEAFDENGMLIALDRVAQRMEIWAQAEEALALLAAQPTNEALKQIVAALAKATGFFSVWMTVFEQDPDTRQRLIDVFPGTRDSACFDPATAATVSPAPNPDGLDGGGKI